jgi:outer membrane protein assembly factor BamB
MVALNGMRHSYALVLCLAMAAIGPPAVQAQFPTRAATVDSGLRTLGLEQAWRAQLQFDSSRGKLAGIAQHISNTRAQHIVEVTYPGGRIAFSERDLDPFRKPLGAKGARKQADDWAAQWQRRSKSETKPVVKEYVVPDVVLVATSQRGLVQCLDGETGRTLWSVQVGTSRYPTTRASVNETHVAVVNGTTLYVLNRADGRVQWERPIDQTPGAGPALSDTMVFVPMVNGYLQTFHIDEPKRPVATFFAAGRCLVQPIVFQDAVAWPTDRGNLYVGNAEVAGIRFRISAGGPIRSAPTFRPGNKGSVPLVVFASSDGYVYSADLEKGVIVNRFSAGEAVSQSPVAVNDDIYTITDGGTLFCTGAESGTERWSIGEMKSFLASNAGRIYCLDARRRLVGIDSKTGNLFGAVRMDNVDYAFTNLESDRIIVGTQSGMLQCLRESRQRYPVVHAGEASKPTPAKSEIEQPAGTGEGAPAGDNPFGGDAEEEKPATPAAGAAEGNPFGEAPEAMEEEKPVAPAEEDPFG